MLLSFSFGPSALMGVSTIGRRYEVIGSSSNWVRFVILRRLRPNRADQHQALVEVDVVGPQPSCKGRVASKVVIVIANHHRNLDTFAGGVELIENGLVRCDNVIKFCDTLHES